MDFKGDIESRESFGFTSFRRNYYLEHVGESVPKFDMASESTPISEEEIIKMDYRINDLEVENEDLNNRLKIIAGFTEVLECCLTTTRKVPDLLMKTVVYKIKEVIEAEEVGNLEEAYQLVNKAKSILADTKPSETEQSEITESN